MHPPLAEAPNLTSEPETQDGFIPKNCIHTWNGHTKGVSATPLFPNTGHLCSVVRWTPKSRYAIFSRGDRVSDVTAHWQSWDAYTHGNCLRTFIGHVKAVRDVAFSNDGRRFLSCGYGRQMKLWDTETGQCIKRFSNGKTPYICHQISSRRRQTVSCWLDCRKRNRASE